MPCGCQKAKNLPAQAPGDHTIPGPPPPSAMRVATYTVVVGGSPVLTTTKPAAARAEANRLGGSIKVSSRVVEPA